jgi:hypothetical protein
MIAYTKHGYTTTTLTETERGQFRVLQITTHGNSRGVHTGVFNSRVQAFAFYNKIVDTK